MTENTKTIEPGTSLFFEGRAWFDKINGNTYHSVRIWINGDIVEIVPIRYGYEEAYKTSAVEALIELGYLPQTLFQHGEDRPTRDFPVWQIDRKLETVTYSTLTYGKKSELWKKGN